MCKTLQNGRCRCTHWLNRISEWSSHRHVDPPVDNTLPWSWQQTWTLLLLQVGTVHFSNPSILMCLFLCKVQVAATGYALSKRAPFSTWVSQLLTFALSLFIRLNVSSMFMMLVRGASLSIQEASSARTLKSLCQVLKTEQRWHLRVNNPQTSCKLISAYSRGDLLGTVKLIRYFSSFSHNKPEGLQAYGFTVNYIIPVDVYVKSLTKSGGKICLSQYVLC